MSYQAEERENERLAGLYSFGRRLVSLRACRQAPPGIDVHVETLAQDV